MDKKIILPVTAIAVVAILFYIIKSTQPVPGQITTNPGNEPVVTVSIVAKTVSVQTSYRYHSGEEKVGFKLGLAKDGTITKAETEVLATAPKSVTLQKSFAQELPSVVVGKKIQDLKNIDKVGGASLTTASFNQMLPALQQQATI